MIYLHSGASGCWCLATFLRPPWARSNRSKLQVRHMEGIWRMKLSSGLNDPPQGPFWGTCKKESEPDIITSTSTFTPNTFSDQKQLGSEWCAERRLILHSTFKFLPMDVRRPSLLMTPFLFLFWDLNSFVVNAVYLRPIYLQNWHHNMSGIVVHLLGWPTQALCSNLRHQTKRHHVPLGWCDCEGSSPALGSLLAACFWLFFLWLWLV